MAFKRKFILDPKKYYGVKMETSFLMGEAAFKYFPEGIPFFHLYLHNDLKIDNKNWLYRVYRILRHLNPELSQDKFTILCKEIALPKNYNLAEGFKVPEDLDELIVKAFTDDSPLETEKTKKRKIFFNESIQWEEGEKQRLVSKIIHGWDCPDGELILDAIKKLQNRRVRINRESIAKELQLTLKQVNYYFKEAGPGLTKDIKKRNEQAAFDQRQEVIYEDLFAYWKKTKRIRKVSHYHNYFRLGSKEKTTEMYQKAVRKVQVHPTYKKYVRRMEEKEYE